MDMKRTITLVYDRHLYTYKWLKIMYACRKEFLELGYKVRYQSLLDFLPTGEPGEYGLEEMAYKSACKGKKDIVMLAFHHSTSKLCQLSKEERGKILSKIKQHCNCLIWMDTADSTGTCMFDVMPYVDLYFKKQMLKDPKEYLKEMYGARSFCEYYHNLLGVEDPVISTRKYEPLEAKYIPKLRLAWNVGIGDLYIRGRQIFLRPFKMTAPKFLDPYANKELDVQYRGSGYSPIAGYPRSQAKKLLQEMTDIRCSDVTKKIPKEEYIKEGQNANAILSPFGWGEICGRDFEAIVYGACMIKQDMSHCVTYPDVYQPGVTYVPLKWDFSDFKEVLRKSNTAAYKSIAKQAQDYYKFFFTKEGRKDFAKHIVNELTR